MVLGRASYEPGWKWSKYVSSIAGTPLCEVEHVGMVLSGRAIAAMNDGTEVELTAGSLFYLPPIAHDSVVERAFRMDLYPVLLLDENRHERAAESCH
jgi:hypothetical protein